MKTRYKHMCIYTVNLPSVEKENVPEIFEISTCGINIEIHSDLAEKGDAKNLLKILEDKTINAVTYAELFFENIELPEGFLRKKKLNKRRLPKNFLEEEKEFLEEFEGKRSYSKLRKPLHLEKNKRILSKILHLPRVKPQRFAALCELLKNESSSTAYYNEDIKNYFPFHPEPYSFVSDKDVIFSMIYHRSILVTNEFFTNITISASYDPKKGDFLDKSVDLVQKSMNFLLNDKISKF